jgi:hypothetical protein
VSVLVPADELCFLHLCYDAPVPSAHVQHNAHGWVLQLLIVVKEATLLS